MACVGAIALHITQSSQIHQPVVCWITTSCLLVQGRQNHLKTMQSSSHSMQSRTPVCMTSFRNIHSKSSLENFQHSHSPELYSLCACSYSYIYYLMVKSVSCCSVHAWKPLCSFLAIWLATYFFVILSFLLNSEIIKVYNLVHTIKTVIAKFDLFALY